MVEFTIGNAEKYTGKIILTSIRIKRKEKFTVDYDGKMLVELWSDIACPYCYIGKKRYEEALEKFPHRDKIHLVWHSYELNPDLEKKALGKSFYEYFAESHGCSVEEAKTDCAEISKLADESGLTFNFDKLVITNTSDALRLVKLAQSKGLGDKANNILYKAYFTDGENVSDKSTLIRLGKQIGLQEESITKMLGSKTYLAEIEKDIDYSENGLNLEYIPFYLFNNKHIIQGIISVNEYLEMFDKAFAEWEQSGIGSGKGETKKGRACTPDGTCSI